MKKYEIIKNEMETNFHKFAHYEAGCTTQQTAQEPETIASFDTLAEAQEELKKYACRVLVREGYTNKLIYVTEYYIEENVYTDLGDFDQCNDLWDFAPLEIDETKNNRRRKNE